MKELAKVINSEENVPLIAVEIRKLVKPQYMFFFKFVKFLARLLNSYCRHQLANAEMSENFPFCNPRNLYKFDIRNIQVSKNMFNIEGVSRTLLVLFSFCHFAKCVFLYFWLDYHFTKVLKRTPSLDDTERKRRSISFRFSINLQYIYLAWRDQPK